ncbi:MAG: OsmC family protein [Deltaproteobacteria bacterium]|nr:OsmC family protein [Deltaproteobacteria bacterium]
MPTITESYLGGLRVECVHEQSGTKLVTDAPTDNKGKGESFSPTDLLATALASCAITTMGIYADAHGLDVSGATLSATKTMAANPRRISSIEVILKMPDRDYTEKQKKSLENAARACPVHHSLHPDMEKKLTILWAR